MLRALTWIFFSIVMVANGSAIAESKSNTSTADHRKFEQLKVKFKTGPEVTRVCLECHTNAAKQIHQTKHWNWEYKNPDTGQMLGKRHVVNNFCIFMAIH